MTITRPFKMLLAKSRSLLRSTSGNVGMMFGLMLVPLIAVAGSAVDYGRAATDRTKMQAALDSTALMLAKEAYGLSPDQIQSKARSYFMALMGTTEVTSFTVSAVYTESGASRIDLDASGMVHTSFMGIVGIEKVPIATKATATWGNTRLRVSLVLDNTGSMADDGKMDALKVATNKLLDILKGTAINSEDVYVSIIPFNKDVNAGKPNFDKSWVRWDLWDAANGSCSKNPSSNNTLAKCQSAKGTWTPKAHNTWNGCVTDRDQSYDVKWADPVVSLPATHYPAEQYSSCPVGMLELTNNWNALSDKVTEMKSVGNTNQTIGLQWGFQSLMGTSPLTVPAQQSGYTYEHVVVLLTDGLNTQNRWSTSQSTIDARTKIACDNLKTAGVTVYSIQVNTGGDPTSTMLKNCATNPAKYFMLTSATQIVATFDQIGTELSKLRLSL